MHARPLAALIATGDGGLVASHLPFLIEEAGSGLGVLRAHLPRADEQLARLRNGGEALAIFTGPDAYVTPSWYASKAEHGRVVPTWNYVAVYAWGTPRVVEDAGWIRGQLERLTAAQEDARTQPWAVGDAPEDYVAGMIKGIVGLEIPITRLEGKWKVSQNRSNADRRGVVEGLESDGETEIARLVAERGAPD